MSQLLRFLRRYPLTLLCVAAVWYLSLYRVPPPPVHLFSWFDKLVHCLMYASISALVWVEYGRQHRQTRVRPIVVAAWLMPVAMGGLVELAQAYLTTYRSGEWLDFVANSVGATLSSLVGAAVYRRLGKWQDA